MGTAPLGRLLLSLSLPGMASMITLALYNIVDTYWVAKLGHEAIAALTIVLPFHILVISIAAGTGIGVSALTSRRFGERDIEAANHAAGQVFPITIVSGAVFLVAAVFFAGPILTAAGATPDIMDYATQYLVIIGFSIPGLIFSIIAGNLLRGSGDALRPMVFMLVSTVVNMILDPFMILGIGPFPRMEVRGAAWATVIAQVLSTGLYLIYILARKSAYRIRLLHLRPSLPILRDIYRVGFPSMVMEASESFVFALFNYVLAGFGSLALAAGGLAIRIMDLAFMPIFGASQGLLPVIGYSLGARLWARLWGAVKLASWGLALLMAAATIILTIYAPATIGIFTEDPELLAIGVPAMRIMLSTLSIIGVSILFITAFQGLAKGKDALVLSLVRQLVFFIPALFYLSHILGLTGVWLSAPVSDVLGFVVAGLWLLREYRQQRRSGLWVEAPATGPGPGE